MGVTVDDARAIAATLPRSYEALVRDEVRFRVGRMVYAAFYDDETIMGFGFPREEREALVASGTASLGAATPYFQVDSAGFKFSSGTNGSLYFKHSTGYFNATASPSSADSIPYWDNSEGVVAYMTIGTGLSITGTAPNQVLTSTATGGTPGGATYDIQYRTAVPNFGGITQTSGGLLMGTSGAPPFFTTTFAALRYTFTPSSTIASLQCWAVGHSGHWQSFITNSW